LPGPLRIHARGHQMAGLICPLQVSSAPAASSTEAPET
jgi:hypothetical protein